MLGDLAGADIKEMKDKECTSLLHPLDLFVANLTLHVVSQTLTCTRTSFWKTGTL